MSSLIGINVGFDWFFSVNSPTIALNKSVIIGPLLSTSDIFELILALDGKVEAGRKLFTKLENAFKFSVNLESIDPVGELPMSDIIILSGYTLSINPLLKRLKLVASSPNWFPFA
jgi:hypothetical protein